LPLGLRSFLSAEKRITNALLLRVIFCHAGKVCTAYKFFPLVRTDIRIRIPVIVIRIREAEACNTEPLPAQTVHHP